MINDVEAKGLDSVHRANMDGQIGGPIRVRLRPTPFGAVLAADLLSDGVLGSHVAVVHDDLSNDRHLRRPHSKNLIRCDRNRRSRMIERSSQRTSAS